MLRDKAIPSAGSGNMGSAVSSGHKGDGAAPHADPFLEN